jgi:hypothetical protein
MRICLFPSELHVNEQNECLEHRKPNEITKTSYSRHKFKQHRGARPLVEPALMGHIMNDKCYLRVLFSPRTGSGCRPSSKHCHLTVYRQCSQPAAPSHSSVYLCSIYVYLCVSMFYLCLSMCYLWLHFPQRAHQSLCYATQTTLIQLLTFDFTFRRSK